MTFDCFIKCGIFYSRAYWRWKTFWNLTVGVTTHEWILLYNSLHIMHTGRTIHYIQGYDCQVKPLNTLQWRHNGHDGVWKHQPPECLLNRLFRHRSKKTSNLCVTGPCGQFTGDRWLPRTKGQQREKCSHLMTSSWDYRLIGKLIHKRAHMTSL